MILRSGRVKPSFVPERRKRSGQVPMTTLGEIRFRGTGPLPAQQRVGLMVKQPGATCPGSPEGAIAGLGQVRHRLGSRLDLAAGGIGYGASAERLRDRSPPTVSTVGFSAQEIAAESGAALRDSGGTSPQQG